MKKGSIFDMDGLLFDTERLYRDSWVEMAVKFGQTPDPAFPRAICGTSGEHSLEVIHAHYPTVDAAEFHACGIARVQEMLENGVPEKPGIREILSYFREHGVKTAVASSSGRAMIESNLRRAQVIGYFDVIVSGDQIRHGKPEPDIFLEAARRLGCAPEDCYVLEDGINGVRAGLAAGCATIMIPDLTEPTEELRAACAGVYPSLLAALDAIRREA